MSQEAMAFIPTLLLAEYYLQKVTSYFHAKYLDYEHFAVRITPSDNFGQHQPWQNSDFR